MRTTSLLSQSACLALLAACAGAAPVSYAGPLTPQSGTCDAPSRAVLVMRGRDLQFTPSQGVLVLAGQIAPSGEIAAASASPGADHKPYRLKLAATLSGADITGTYVTPRCRYTVHLTRAP